MVILVIVRPLCRVLVIMHIRVWVTLTLFTTLQPPLTCKSMMSVIMHIKCEVNLHNNTSYSGSLGTHQTRLGVKLAGHSPVITVLSALLAAVGTSMTVCNCHYWNKTFYDIASKNIKNLSRIMLHTGIDIYAVPCIRDNIHTRAEVARLTKTADPNYGVLDFIQYKCRWSTFVRWRILSS